MIFACQARMSAVGMEGVVVRTVVVVLMTFRVPDTHVFVLQATQANSAKMVRHSFIVTIIHSCEHTASELCLISYKHHHWLSEQKCTCPPQISNAYADLPSVFYVGSMVTYACFEGYRFPDNSTSAVTTVQQIICSEKQEWVPEITDCKGEKMLYVQILVDRPLG